MCLVHFIRLGGFHQVVTVQIATSLGKKISGQIDDTATLINLFSLSKCKHC